MGRGAGRACMSGANGRTAVPQEAPFIQMTAEQACVPSTPAIDVHSLGPGKIQVLYHRTLSYVDPKSCKSSFSRLMTSVDYVNI